MVDTCVLIAGISAFKANFQPGRIASADILYDWAEQSRFDWLVTKPILEEYAGVAHKLHVRPHIIGRMLNLLREGAKEITLQTDTAISPDPGDNAFCLCSEDGRADYIVTLNPRHFPQDKLSARVVSPEDFLTRIR